VAELRIWDVYTGQEYLTPGARETLGLIDATVPLSDGARVLDVAYGKGSGAFRIAERHRCRVLGVDPHPFAARVARAAALRGCADSVAFVIGDGGRLPVRDGSFDAAICVGGPSIVGTERCLEAMARALRRGGWLVASDWVWRETPVPPEAIPSGYAVEPITLDGYAALAAGRGFEIVYAEPLPQSAWDDYYAPIRDRVAELRALRPDDPPQPVEDELRVWDSGLGPAWWRYAVVIAQKR